MSDEVFTECPVCGSPFSEPNRWWHATPTEEVQELAQSFLDKEQEDWTFVDPDDVKALARAVLGK